jgi:hydantoinase/carbamoylase family amidase
MNAPTPHGLPAGLPPDGDLFGARIMSMADHLAQWSETPQGLTCTYLSKAHRAVANSLSTTMKAAGLDTHVDAVGNVVGRYKSKNKDAKTVIVGSHYDTVTNAGKYDGRLGVVTAIAVVEYIARMGGELPFHVDVIAFSEEEGVRFGGAYIGSSAIAGRFDFGLLEYRDANGVLLREALREAGFDPAAIPAVAYKPSDLRAYLEVHIEQGPVLFESDLPVGIVTAIAGNSRFNVTIAGEAGHAGTVPMPYRHDAAVAAAEIILCVEQRCSQTGLVGTVGRLVVPDGAGNVVPGRCELSIDVRSGTDRLRHAAVKDILADIRDVGQRRGVKIETTELMNRAAVPCSPKLQDAFAASIASTGLPVYRLPSGAGHDAVMFEGVTEIGMLFVRCGNKGISHSPLETISAADADFAGKILLDTLVNLKI